MWTLAFQHHEDCTPTHVDPRGRDGGVCEELAAEVVLRDWEVRFRGQTEKHLLVLSFTGFDPNPT
jgi:hypothetical protein